MAPLTECYTGLMVFINMVAAGTVKFELDDVQNAVARLLDKSRKDALMIGADEQKWKEGLFPVAAWVDERILCSSWQDRERWIRLQLQRRYFNISNAGDLFFENLESKESMTRDVLAVYDMVLAAGFKGSHFSRGLAGELKEIRRSVMEAAAIPAGTQNESMLFSEAYEGMHKNKEKKADRLFRNIDVRSVIVALIPPLLIAGMYFVLDNQLDRLFHQFFGL